MIEYENLELVNKKLFDAYKDSFEEFLKGGWYVLGGSVLKFEQEFAEYHNANYAIGVASGLDALVLALDVCHFPKDSEIIVPSNTYIATILAIIRNGFKPVLVEPDIATYNIDPTKIEEKITAKTKAIMVVHLYGKVCDMDPIVAIAHRYGLIIIEDVAQAHGALYKGKKAGTFGIGCFSFYPTKNLGALGDAGAIITNDQVIDKKLRSLRNYGSAVKYYNDDLGYNSRLDEIQAGFLSIKLKILDDINAHKRQLAKLYIEYLSDEFVKPIQDSSFYDVYHIFTIRHPKRDELRAFLLESGIKTEIHYPLAPHKQKAMKDWIKEDYPISDQIHSTTLSLPISFFHTEDDVAKVCDVINRWTK